MPLLCTVSNHITDLIYNQFPYLLRYLNQPWLAPIHLQDFANAVHAKGGALDNYWGFIDGTVQPIFRSKRNQRVVYNGHKRIHALIFQAVSTPNGLIANLFGPVEGRRHDSALLAMSGLLNQLEERSFSPNGNALCLYGEPAYPQSTSPKPICERTRHFT